MAQMWVDGCAPEHIERRTGKNLNLSIKERKRGKREKEGEKREGEKKQGERKSKSERKGREREREKRESEKVRERKREKEMEQRREREGHKNGIAMLCFCEKKARQYEKFKRMCMSMCMIEKMID